jgi:hypothetical protein
VSSIERRDADVRIAVRDHHGGSQERCAGCREIPHERARCAFLVGANAMLIPVALFLILQRVFIGGVVMTGVEK